MKNRILILFLVLLSVPAVAQYNGFIAIRSGASLPVGNYHAANLEKGSFAQPGLNVSINGAWFFSQHFGVGAQAGFQLHPIDVAKLTDVKIKTDPFLSDVVIRSEPFQVIQGGVGLYTRWSLTRTISAHAKVIGGMIWATTPYQLYKPTYFMAGPDYYEITSSKNRQLFVEPGVGIQFRINYCLALKVEAEWVNRTMKFGFLTNQGVRYDMKQISFINTLLGLVILL